MEIKKNTFPVYLVSPSNLPDFPETTYLAYGVSEKFSQNVSNSVVVLC